MSDDLYYPLDYHLCDLKLAYPVITHTHYM